MARIHAAIIAAALLFVVGQCSNSNGAAPMTEAEVYWRSVLPDSPLPEFILRLLHPEEASYVNKDDETDDAQGLSAAHALLPLPRDKHSSLRRPSQDHSTKRLAHGSKLYFYEEALQVGKNMTISFPPAASTPLGLLPRTVADSMPFSTSSLPSALAQLGIAKDSMQAAKMYETLKMCETPSLTSEAKFCARSLEALVEGAMVVLGTRDIRAVTSKNLPHSGAPREPYTIRAVRHVDGSSFMLSCHYAYYPYTVFMCHDRGSVTRVYMVEIEGVHSGMHITVASVCHIDTSQWEPEHISFKLLGTKPGGAPICHYMPYGDMLWVNKLANRSSS